MLANFADNLFAIGRSPHQPDIRYIKHIKPRNTAVTYDASNVIVCRLEKPHNFPRFAFVELAPESRHTTNHYDNSNADRQHLINHKPTSSPPKAARNARSPKNSELP